MFSGNREAVSISRLATNPIIISFIISIVLYLSQIQLPVVIKTTLNYISGMNAPIAMIIIGVYFGQISIKSLFIDKVTYVSSLVRLFLIPLLTIAVLSFIPACYLDIKLGVLIAASAPIGSNIIIFAEIYKLDCKRAVKEVCMSTICSLLSMPIIITIAEMVW